jgi:hypothetical protein
MARNGDSETHGVCKTYGRKKKKKKKKIMGLAVRPGEIEQEGRRVRGEFVCRRKKLERRKNRRKKKK